MNIIFVVFALACVIVPSFAVTAPFTHHAILTSDQVGSPASTSAAWGAAIFSLNGGKLDYTIVNNVAGSTAAHIHAAAPGVNGGVVATITGFENGGAATVTGSVTLNSADVQSLNNGQTYLNIHTSAYPGGEIRGQILCKGQQVTVLTPAQASATSTASAAALVIFDAATNNLTTVLMHNVANATAAHIHGPAAPGSSAGVIVPLATTATATQTLPIVTTATLTAAQVADLESGLYYFNVHSDAFPGGEVRGQISPIVNFLGQLDGTQDNQQTNEHGVGVASLYGTTLITQVYHTVAAPTAAHIHTGAPGVAGGVIFTYSSAASPITQTFTATSDQAASLAAGGYYFNVHTAAVPAGLIRGQIYAKGAAAPSATTSTTSSTSAASSTSAPFVVLFFVLLVNFFML